MKIHTLIVYDGKGSEIGASTNAAWQTPPITFNCLTEKFDFEIEPNESDKFETKEEVNNPQNYRWMKTAIPEGKEIYWASRNAICKKTNWKNWT